MPSKSASKFELLNGSISGSGTTTVILSHGFGTDQTAWSQLRGWLEQRFRVVCFDLAGAGPNGDLTYDAARYSSLFGYADDLLEIVDEQGLRDSIYVAHSVSSMIGAAAAVARPHLFRRMVFIGASPRYLNDGGYTGGFEQENLNGLYDAMSSNFQAWGAGFAPMVVGVQDDNALKDFSRTLFLMRPDIALTTCRTIFQSDMRDIASRLDCPVHLVQTQRDMAVPLEVAQWLHANIRGATLDVIDAEGHLPHMTAPDRIIRLFEKHLLTAGVAA